MMAILISAVILSVSIVCYFLAYSYALQFALWLGVTLFSAFAVAGVLLTHKEFDWLAILLSFATSMRIPSFSPNPSMRAFPVFSEGFHENSRIVILTTNRHQTVRCVTS